MADNSQANNIVLKCHYYKPNNTNEEYANTEILLAVMAVITI